MQNFNRQIQKQFAIMCATGKLFRATITGQEIYDIYLRSFYLENNPIFRDPTSSEHNCNHCNNFIRRYGNVVAIIDNKIVSMFTGSNFEEEYKNSAIEMDKAITASPVADIFTETFRELNSLPYETCQKHNTVFRLGVDKNVKRYTKEEAEKFGVVQPNEIRTFHHLHLDLPCAFVDKSDKSAESIMADYRDAKNVFKRAMDEISLDTLLLVKDLINQGSLLDGQTHLYKIEQIIPLKKQYDALPESEKDNWCWIASYKLPFAKFKNELIGVLCSELSEGEEINKACQSWNKRVDPANYMKATAPITQKQIAEAETFVLENGYAESFNRRFANIEDIKVSEIKHINSGTGDVKPLSVFDNVKPTKSRHKRNEFDGVEEVHIDRFMKDILPGCASVEAFLQNNHSGNMVSLTTANDPDSKKIFKWGNNYSWTFNGNLAGKSQIKEAIKGRGGKVEGCLNIRLHFPNTVSDYDLHILEPNRNEIYWSNRRHVHKSSGMLDLDAQGGDGSFPPESRVENIIYTDQNKMPIGDYLVYVNNFSRRDSNFGFEMEIEVDGEITCFAYNKDIRQGANVEVCRIHFDGRKFTIKPLITASEGATIIKEVYGLETNQFHKVNLVCLSPNHWEGNEIGNKHYFFMLEGAKCPTSIRSFHNENLNADLLQHRKVMEVLGAKTMIEPTDKQLSGLGFNATVKDELIVKLTGNFKRVLKIKFHV